MCGIGERLLDLFAHYRRRDRVEPAAQDQHRLVGFDRLIEILGHRAARPNFAALGEFIDEQRAEKPRVGRNLVIRRSARRVFGAHNRQAHAHEDFILGRLAKHSRLRHQRRVIALLRTCERQGQLRRDLRYV